MTKDRPEELSHPARILLGPGPSCLDPRVYRALQAPMLGHLDPDFLRIMEETQGLLRRLFATENHLTFPVSATGSAGMETAMANALEPGDTAVLAVAGFFSARMAEMAARAGAEVIEVNSEPGQPVEPEQVLAAARGKKVKLLAMVHGETSTGVAHDLDAYRRVADELGALLVVDAVATCGGMPLRVDAQRLDICFTASQKCLSAPPGLAPFTAGARAEEIFRNRKSRVTSWFFDLSYIMKYWGGERTYHHTAPISMVYALREALRLVEEEGLEVRWERHRRCQAGLVAGLEAMGLSLLAAPEHRMWTVTAVKVPPGIEEGKVRRRLLEEFNIEIAGGLGPLKGKIWRIGLMGYSCSEANVLLLLAALEKIFTAEGFKLSAGAGVAAANQFLSRAPVSVQR
jgi:alanine-glyoxylate transaminase/serine-glyoxylate transaminase/serine-pyruvate transaminase